MELRTLTSEKKLRTPTENNKKRQRLKACAVFLIWMSMPLAILAGTSALCVYILVFSPGTMEPVNVTHIIEDQFESLTSSEPVIKRCDGSQCEHTFVCSGNKTQDIWNVVWILEYNNGRKEMISSAVSNGPPFNQNSCPGRSSNGTGMFSYRNVIRTTEHAFTSTLAIENVCQQDFKLMCLMMYRRHKDHFKIVHDEHDALRPNYCEGVCGELVMVS